jgi:hypothetical protein
MDGRRDNYLPHYSGISSHSKELVQETEKGT